MYLQIESQRTFHRPAYSRLAEWWPAALIGLVALLSGLPDANAGTARGGCEPSREGSVPYGPGLIRAVPWEGTLYLLCSAGRALET